LFLSPPIPADAPVTYSLTFFPLSLFLFRCCGFPLPGLLSIGLFLNRLHSSHISLSPLWFLSLEISSLAASLFSVTDLDHFLVRSHIPPSSFFSVPLSGHFEAVSLQYGTVHASLIATVCPARPPVKLFGSPIVMWIRCFFLPFPLPA